MTVNELTDYIYENNYKRVGFNKKVVIIQWSIRKKDLLSFPSKLKQKYLILAILKNAINFNLRKKTRNW